jgi:hypothetical protein
MAELPCRAGVRRANQLAAAAGPHPGEVVDGVVLAVSKAVTTAVL